MSFGHAEEKTGARVSLYAVQPEQSAPFIPEACPKDKSEKIYFFYKL